MRSEFVETASNYLILTDDNIVVITFDLVSGWFMNYFYNSFTEQENLRKEAE